MKKFIWTECGSFCHNRKIYNCDFNENYNFLIEENKNNKFSAKVNNYDNHDDCYIIGSNYKTLDEAKQACVKYMEEEVIYLQNKINNILN